MDVDKYIDRYIESSKLSKIKTMLGLKAFLAFFFGVGFAINAFVTLNEGEEFVFFWGAALFLIYIGMRAVKSRKAVENIRNYVKVIGGEPTYAIGKISSKLGMSEQMFRTNMNFLIKKGLIKNIKMNYLDNSVIVTGVIFPVKNKPIKRAVPQKTKTEIKTEAIAEMKAEIKAEMKAEMEAEAIAEMRAKAIVEMEARAIADMRAKALEEDFKAMYAKRGKLTGSDIFQLGVGTSGLGDLEGYMYQGKKEEIRVVCGCCGAKTKIIEGEKADCEYCGSAL